MSVVSKWELEEVKSGKYEKPTYGLRSGGKEGCELALAINKELINKFSGKIK